MLDGFKLHFQGFGPLTGEDFFTLVEIVLDHLCDGFIIRQVSDDTGHIRIPGKLAGFLAAVAGHDLIAAILTGTDDSGLGHALVLDAGHHSPHFFIIPDFKGMVLEGVELVQLDIDDLLLAPAWSILWLFGSFRSGSGLYRWSRFFLRFLFDRLFRFLCGSFGLRGCVLVLICFRGTAPALRLFRLFGFFLCFFRSLRLLFRFLRFCRVRLFHAGSCRPFLDFLFLHNFSEVIDRNLWVLYLWFRLFFRLRGNGNLPRLFWGSGRRFLARPAIRYRLFRRFCGFIICHKHLPPVFWHEKRGSTFQSSPRGKFLLSPP